MSLESKIYPDDAHIDICFVPKAILLLSADSPFFDAFWPTIFDGADIQTKRNLELTNSYFRRLAKHERARQLSERLKEDHRHSVETNVPPNPLKLDPFNSTPLWYRFSATYAFFFSVEKFEAFCKLADVDPTGCVDSGWRQYDGDTFPVTTFLSSTGDVHITCIPDPMSNDRFLSRYVGCIGEREKVLRLESWFSENCSCF